MLKNFAEIIWKNFEKSSFSSLLSTKSKTRGVDGFFLLPDKPVVMGD